MNNTGVLINKIGEIVAVILAQGLGELQAIQAALSLSPDVQANMTFLSGDALSADQELIAKADTWLAAHPANQ